MITINLAVSGTKPRSHLEPDDPGLEHVELVFCDDEQSEEAEIGQLHYLVTAINHMASRYRVVAIYHLKNGGGIKPMGVIYTQLEQEENQ